MSLSPLFSHFHPIARLSAPINYLPPFPALNWISGKGEESAERNGYAAAAAPAGGGGGSGSNGNLTSGGGVTNGFDAGGGLTNGGNSNSAANLASTGGGGDADGSEGGSTLDRRKASMYVKNRANMQKGTR